MPEPTLDLPRLRNDKENVMKNIFDLRSLILSYDIKIGEVLIPILRANSGSGSSKSTNAPIGRIPF